MTIADAIRRLGDLKDLYERLITERDKIVDGGMATLSKDDLEDCIAAVSDNIRHIRQTQVEC